MAILVQYMAEIIFLFIQDLLLFKLSIYASTTLR